MSDYISKSDVIRIIERLEEELKFANTEIKRTVRENLLQTDFAMGYSRGIENTTKIVKEEGGIE